MPAEFNVGVGAHIPGFFDMMRDVKMRQAFPKVLERLNVLATLYQRKWRSFAQGEQIEGCPHVINSRGDYAKSIKVDLSNETTKIIYTTSPHHEGIEKGHEDIDLKPGLLSGPKARHSTNTGTTYNIVAFRHDSPSKTARNPMPVNIYNIVKSFEQSKMSGTFPDSKNLARNTYTWKDRLSAGQGGEQETKKISADMQKKLSERYGIEVSKKYKWKTGKYAGMVRMQENTESAKNSAYMTFRVVSSRSDPASWIVPKRAPIPIRQAVVDAMREITEKAIADAVEEDIGRKKGVDK